MPAAGAPVRLDRDTIINAQRANWQIETNTESKVRGHMLSPKIVTVGVDKAGVVKNCPARLCHDGKSQLCGRARHRVSAERFAMFVAWPDVAKSESTQVV